MKLIKSRWAASSLSLSPKEEGRSLYISQTHRRDVIVRGLCIYIRYIYPQTVKTTNTHEATLTRQSPPPPTPPRTNQNNGTRHRQTAFISLWPRLLQPRPLSEAIHCWLQYKRWTRKRALRYPVTRLRLFFTRARCRARPNGGGWKAQEHWTDFWRILDQKFSWCLCLGFVCRARVTEHKHKSNGFSMDWETGGD